MKETLIENEYNIETENFGTCGLYEVYQTSSSEYLDICLFKNSNNDDSTGCRVYVGAHVLIRFLTSSIGFRLTNDRSVVELGCGTGIVGILGFKLNHFRNIVISDGNSKACSITSLNLAKFNYQNDASIRCCNFPWTNSSALLSDMFESYNSGNPFDVVIGSELVYYRTDMELLIATVIGLTNFNGIFIHSHLFRDAEQEKLMIDTLKLHEWITAAIPLHIFTTPEEIRIHPHWSNVCTLISGPDCMIRELIVNNPFWSEFTTCEQAQFDSLGQSSSLDEDCMFDSIFN